MSISQDIRWGVKHGLGLGVFYSMFVTVLYVVTGGGNTHDINLPLGSLVAFYLLGGVFCGATVGVLRPLARSKSGAYVVAAAASIPAVIGAVSLRDGPPSQWTPDAIIAAPICVIAFSIIGVRHFWTAPPSQPQRDRDSGHHR
jgi:hypothetical protein